MTKGVSVESLIDIGRRLVRLHKPIKINYRAKFGLDKIENIKPLKSIDTLINNPVEIVNKKIEVNPKELSYCCKKCNSFNIKILYGKFGYYFKCNDCDGNTNLKIECGNNGHNERLRKEGNKFFRECTECKTSSLFYENK